MCTQKKGDETVSPRTGRATEEDREKLLYCCEKTGMTQYDVVMKGIDKVYNEIRATEALDK